MEIMFDKYVSVTAESDMDKKEAINRLLLPAFYALFSDLKDLKEGETILLRASIRRD